MDKDTSIGRVIGNYHILDKVGQGGFGSVYRAEHVLMQSVKRIVAIKIAHNRHNALELPLDFIQEAEMLLKLRHRSILPLIDFGYDKGDLYLITEFAARGTLKDRIPQPPKLLPTQEVCEILSQIGQALNYIHQRDIIHRDLKPANILFNAQDEALLADFGIAIMTSAEATKEKGAGTPHYMAPEQFKGEGSKWSDQYAFAIIAYELFTGRIPFKANSIPELYLQHMTKEPVDPRNFNHDISEFRALAILKALAKEPKDRYDDINAFLAALKVQYVQETIVFMSQTYVSKKDKEELLNKASMLTGGDHPEDALKIYDQLIALEPASAKAYCGKGDVLIKQSEHILDALAAYNQAISFDPAFLPAIIGRGNVLYLLGRFRQALEAYRKVVQVAPDATLYLKIADILIKHKVYKDALISYDEAIRYGADPIDICNKKIRLLIDCKWYSQAAEVYDHIIRLSSDPIAAWHKKKEFLFNIRHQDEDFVINEAPATYDQIIKMKHGTIEVYYEALADLEQLIDNSKRLSIYDWLIGCAPNEIKIDVNYRKIAWLEEHHRLDEVPIICSQIIELDPDNTNAHYKKLETFKKLEWPKDILNDALENCNQIIKRMPDKLDPYHIKLNVLELLKRYDEALETCEQILALDPECSDAHYRKGHIYETLERTYGGTKGGILKARFNRIPSYYLSALDAYEKASQLSSDNPLYCESKGKLLRHLGKFHQAEIACSKSMSNHSTFFWPLWALTLILLPFLINVIINAVLLGFFQHLWDWTLIITTTLIISILGTGVIILCDRRGPNQKYHLYKASVLFCPTAFFAIEWLIMDLLLNHPEISVSLLFHLTCLLLIVFINIVMYTLIDIQEEYTFILIWKGFTKVVRWITEILIKILRRFIDVYHEYMEEIRKQKELQRNRDPKKALSQKTSAKKPIVSHEPPKKKNRPQRQKCDFCQGRGRISCNFCKAKGYKIVEYRAGKKYFRERVQCPMCSGRGSHSCLHCKGKGNILLV